MRQRLQKFLRRFPRNFSLTALMVLVTFCAVVSYHLAPWLSKPREYPCLRIAKFQDDQCAAPANQSIVIVVRYQPQRKGSEFYSDYAPWGTVNRAIESYDESETYYYEEDLTRALGASNSKVPDVDQARFDALLQYVGQRINLDSKPWGWSEEILLPTDFPTFAEFKRAYVRKTGGTPRRQVQLASERPYGDSGD